MLAVLNRLKRIKSIMANARKPATARGYFDGRILVPQALCSVALDQAQGQFSLDHEDKVWFLEHVETWLRYLHANNPKWRTILERESEKDRDTVIAFVTHWAEAFLKDPKGYKATHPHLKV